MNNEWYIHKSGQSQGPYTSEQIIQFLNQGFLQQNEFVWKEGLSEWIMASQAIEMINLGNQNTQSPMPLNQNLGNQSVSWSQQSPQMNNPKNRSKFKGVMIGLVVMVIMIALVFGLLGLKKAVGKKNDNTQRENTTTTTEPAVIEGNSPTADEGVIESDKSDLISPSDDIETVAVNLKGKDYIQAINTNKVYYIAQYPDGDSGDVVSVTFYGKNDSYRMISYIHSELYPEDNPEDIYSTMEYISSDRGVTIADFYYPGDVYLHLPNDLDKGYEWTEENGGIINKILDNDATVNVNNMTFDHCLVIEYNNTIVEYETVSYYAPGIGLIMEKYAPEDEALVGYIKEIKRATPEDVEKALLKTYSDPN